MSEETKAVAVAVAVAGKTAPGKRPGEFELVLADGVVRRFRINPEGAVRFEGAAGKPFSKFNVESVSDLADFLKSMTAREESKWGLFDADVLMRKMRACEPGPSLLSLLPLGETALLKIQFAVLRALFAVREKELPAELAEQIERELGEVEKVEESKGRKVEDVVRVAS